jgi:hypothetical protein
MKLAGIMFVCLSFQTGFSLLNLVGLCIIYGKIGKPHNNAISLKVELA